MDLPRLPSIGSYPGGGGSAKVGGDVTREENERRPGDKPSKINAPMDGKWQTRLGGWPAPRKLIQSL